MDISPTIGFAAECPYVLELDKTIYFFLHFTFSLMPASVKVIIFG